MLRVSRSSLALWRQASVNVTLAKPSVFVGGLAAPAWTRRYSSGTVDYAQLLCYHASQGNMEEIQELVEKTDINAVDYDNRTALHLAAAEGRLDVVRYLVENGAHVDVVDRWGGTPLNDAIKSQHTEVSNYLRELGAVLADSSLEMCDAVVKRDFDRVQFLVAEGYNVSAMDYDHRTPLHLAAAQGDASMTQYLLDHGAEVDIVDRFGCSPLVVALTGGHTAVADALRAGGAKISEIEACSEVRTVQTKDEYQHHLADTQGILTEEGVFNTNVISQEVDWFYNKLRLQSYYFRRFSPADTADHIQSYVAAKRLAASTQNRQNIFLSMERTDGGFFLCPEDQEAMRKVEESIEAMTDRLIERAEQGGQAMPSWSLTHFLSGGMAVPYGSKKLSMYILDTTSFSKPASEVETDLEKIATDRFLTSRPDAVKSRYSDILEEAVHRTAPVIKTFPKYRDGTTPIMIAFRNTSVHSPLSAITQLLKASSVTCERKMVETFSNGMTVYSLYTHQRSKKQLQDFVDQVSLLFTAPASSTLTPLFLEGELSAQEYAYCSMAKKFIFYFLSQESEEFKLLHEALQNDRVNTTRLTNVRQRMKRDSVSEARIAECVAEYKGVIKECFAEFDTAFNPDGPRQRPDAGKALIHSINQAAYDELDVAILKEFLVFNRHVLKTNFYKPKKSALACRLDPVFLSDQQPRVPYGIFMMVSRDFQGFHVRFQDVARGGIRLIKSANAAAYARNAESLFMENYNLAATQNLKNKDIPEFGSKGTILLAKDCQHNQKYAFHKYISSMLDLLTENESVVDHLGKPEILFCGPDENTADVMDWAALYAKRRGYSFWKAFTTGKPPSLGGIPHDTYGMTTRSVHKFVTETLKMLNRDESDVTKLQTGGPDGDLGSNEILISCDRTTSIVDGSGVIHDPSGLCREELTRLARARAMVSEFDSNKLGAGGFRVLVEDRNASLPNGEVVDSGLTFRNEFHLNSLSSAELFVPCGGRPESVNAKNVHKLINKDGSPRFRVIVEGANLFFTPEARGILESAGVILFKDASTNKGGVTSSSLEVLAALAMTDTEFAEHMMVADGSEVPPFYRSYVQEVQEKLEENARLEFHCLWKESQKSNRPRHLLTDEVSDKINNLNLSIASSGLWEHKAARDRVLTEAIPRVLQDTVGGLDVVTTRLPEPYCKALFSAYLASRYVYKYGMDANEFCFYEFMREYNQ